jgi:outer membrane protein assembly factor BamB
MTAFSPADGSELWRREAANASVTPGPFDGQGIVFLATDDHGTPMLIGLDVATGVEQWRLPSSEAPLAHSITVAVVSDAIQAGDSTQFRGIDRVTGDEVWMSDIPLSDQSGVMVARSPAAVLGEVLVVLPGATISAIDMETGAMLWQAPHLAHLAAAEGVIVGIEGSNGPAPSITALVITSGKRLWTAPGRPSYGGFLAVGDGAIVVFDPDGTGLVAYELASGNERWRVVQAVHVEPQMISGTSLVGLWEGEIAVVSTIDGATVWSTTQPFRSSLMNSVGSNGDAIVVAINSLPWGD